MAQLLITDAPGGIGDAYQCPHCGRMSLTKRVDDQGIPTDQDAEPPRSCVRCGSPMDTDGAVATDRFIKVGDKFEYKPDGSPAQKFEDKTALEAMKQPAPTARRTVKV